MEISLNLRNQERKWPFHSSILSLCLLVSILLLGMATKPFYSPKPPSAPTVAAITVCRAAPPNANAIRPLKSGFWNSPDTWPNGQLPTMNDDVVVPAGYTLTVLGDCFAKTLTINGKAQAVNWQPEGAWINLRTQSIVVSGPNSLLEIGTESQPYHATQKCIITLVGKKIDKAPDSYKAIYVENGGRLELHGKKRMSWTNIATTANPGAKQITLRKPVDWEVGDVIALTSTALADEKTKSWEQVDQVEIESISPDRRTLKLKQALQYKHVGGTKAYTRARDGKKWNVDIFGEVGLLSHYIKIEGDMTGNNENQGYGGHMMFMENTKTYVENVELYKMGQKGVLGKYPFHWHLTKNTAKGSYFKNSSVHRSFNRAVTIHGTDRVTVDGIFAYDHIGHGIFLEDGGEQYNTIKNNVVFVTRRPKKGEQLIDSDNESNEPQNRTPASYWITNANNYFENNVAAGTEGTGFWIAQPHNGKPGNQRRGKPMAESGKLDHFKDRDPIKEPLGRFDGFVAHTCMSGWDLFDQLNPDHSLDKNGGWKINTNQYIQNGLFYGNETALYCGLGNGGDPTKVVYRNCVFSDNQITTMLAADLTIENCLFNADSDLGVFEGKREFYRFYDGPGRHINCHFEGWDRPNAFFVRQYADGGATENFNPTFRGTTKGFSKPFPFRFYPLTNDDYTRARTIGQFFKDYDGGLTGKAQTTIIRDIAFLRDGHEYRHPSWRNAARSDHYFASFWMAGINESGIAVSAVRSKPGTADACFFQAGTNVKGTYKFPMIVNKGFLYTYHFDKVPNNPKRIHLIWYRGDEGDLGLTCFKGLGKLGGFRVNGGAVRLNTRAAVENAKNSAYFIDGNGDVYVKFRAKGGNKRENVFFEWNNNGTFQPGRMPCNTNDIIGASDIDRDGDGRPDFMEYETCGNPDNASDLNFEFSNTEDLFSTYNINAANTSSSEEWLVFANRQANPYIMRSSLRFRGNQVPILKVRARSQVSGPFTLSWTTTNAPEFAPSRSVKVNIKQRMQYETLTFDMRQISAWMGQTITRIRLGLPPTPNDGSHTWINYIHGPNAASSGNCNNAAKIVHLRKSNAPDYALDGGVGGAREHNVKLWDQNAANVNQQWEEIDRGDGYYSYRKMYTNFCIDGNVGGIDDQNVKLWDCENNNPNQHWRKVAVGNAFQLIKRNADGFAIDGGEGGENDQNVKLWTSGPGNANQHWLISTLAGPNRTLETSIQTQNDTGHKLRVFPNPAQNQITIQWDNPAAKSTLLVSDFVGKQVKAFTTEGNQAQLDISNYKSGIYFITLTGGGHYKTVKFMKE